MNQELKQKLIESGYKGEFGLSELIEACGDRFVSLDKVEDPKGWSCSYEDLEGGIEDVGCFNTPEEAVANLWLELNKK